MFPKQRGYPTNISLGCHYPIFESLPTKNKHRIGSNVKDLLNENSTRTFIEMKNRHQIEDRVFYFAIIMIMVNSNDSGLAE